MFGEELFYIRTDMADEAEKLWRGDARRNSELEGVVVESDKLYGMETLKIEILNDAGERALGKARGRYYSLSLPNQFSRGSEIFESAVKALAEMILRCGADKAGSFLVAALGNSHITPDALGSAAAGHVLVTRHLDKSSFPGFGELSLCRPGVLGCSGMESSLQVQKLCELCRPDMVIAIDALAGSDPERLCRCIQVSDAGISPGSGVGNDRHELSRKSLGLPVIAVGMPTVIDAGHFGGEALGSMFVTPRSIDSAIRDGANLIAYAINMAAHNISVNDIDALVG